MNLEPPVSVAICLSPAGIKVAAESILYIVYFNGIALQDAESTWRVLISASLDLRCSKYSTNISFQELALSS